ncbi:MFS transporter [Lentilactobacillus hilgardii]|uniref:MFS transporter n=2 Tax=Lentilactobacillus hilgardii TaxID=1588 RepID=A0A6P1E833_LENHI|nr:MFS transporter [Lentilactobacillus hilgardii]MCT3393113.1 MFS transporter [Lentilactobacillus hilgardii]QHB51401.1 MFS transporter [Lentilactobacillus hilgardii]RRG10295.1 MAG: MFS transporter [Lactobacillus sp.]
MSKSVPNVNSKTFSFAILSISFMITTGTAISSSLPSMARSFPGIPIAQLDTIATVQQFTVMLFLLASGTISRKIGIKKTINIGLLITGIAGVFPFFSNNFVAILISRLLLGVGIGLFNSLAITVIDLFFQGNNKSQMLGFRSATEQIGVSILNLVVGFLILINWHASFLIYLLAFPIMAFFSKYVPEPPIPTESKNVRQRVNFKVIALTILMMVIVICSTAVIVQIPNIIVSDKLGSATTASLIISANTLAGMVMGILFGKVYQIAKKFTLTIGILFMALGAFIIVIGPNSLVVGLGAIVCGLSYPLVGSYAFNLLGTVAPAGSETLGNSVLLIGANIGSFVTPVALSGLSKLNDLNNQASPFASIFWILIALSAFIFVFQVRMLKKRNSVRLHSLK